MEYYFVHSLTMVMLVIHWLDRLVSGVLILARNASKADIFRKQIEARKVQKQYVARVIGKIVDVKLNYNAREGRSTAEVGNSYSDAPIRGRLLVSSLLELVPVEFIALSSMSQSLEELIKRADNIIEENDNILNLKKSRQYDRSLKVKDSKPEDNVIGESCPYTDGPHKENAHAPPDSNNVTDREGSEATITARQATQKSLLAIAGNKSITEPQSSCTEIEVVPRFHRETVNQSSSSSLKETDNKLHEKSHIGLSSRQQAAYDSLVAIAKNPKIVEPDADDQVWTEVKKQGNNLYKVETSKRHSDSPSIDNLLPKSFEDSADAEHTPHENSNNSHSDKINYSDSMPDSSFAKAWATPEDMANNPESENLLKELKSAFQGQRPITRGFKMKTKR